MTAVSSGPGPTARSGWALHTNVHALRSRRSWGIGDFADLADLAAVAGQGPAKGPRAAAPDFISIGPVGVPADVDGRPDPFHPASMLWLDPVYIAVDAIREMGATRSQDRAVLEWQRERVEAFNVTAGTIDVAAVRSAKLGALATVFDYPRSFARELSFERFVSAGGSRLRDDSQAWADAEDVDPLFFAWLQWVASAQLVEAQRVARESGLPIGLVRTIPLAEDAPGEELVRSVRFALATCGGVRILGSRALLAAGPREGAAGPAAGSRRAVRGGASRTSASDAGAPHANSSGDASDVDTSRASLAGDNAAVPDVLEALIAAKAAGKLRVGGAEQPLLIVDDLERPGHVATDGRLTGRLRAAGILAGATFFAGDDLGRPPLLDELPEPSVLAVGGADDAPAATLMNGEDIDVAESAGAFGPDDEMRVERARTASRRLRENVLHDVTEAGAMPVRATERQRVQALYAFLAPAPPRWVTIDIADAIGDHRPAFVSRDGARGTPAPRYPSFALPLGDSAEHAVSIEELPGHPRVEAFFAGLPRRP